MRDLPNLHGRANACIACHQHVDADILAAGHPELIFELDGQTANQPKHWVENSDWRGAQAWLVGQAVALREISWRLAQQQAKDEDQVARWQALLWLLQKLDDSLARLDNSATSNAFASAQKSSDDLSRRTAESQWATDMTWKHLRKLAATHEEFRRSTPSRPFQARRAERLALALDRLVADLLPNPKLTDTNTQLEKVFAAVQSLPDFEPNKFAELLQQFESRLPAP